MSIRKPVLIVDDSDDSQTALKLFNEKRIEYVQYHTNKLGSGCCGGASDETNTLSAVTAPAIIAPEGIFKGLDGIKNYFDSERRYYESESAYW
jgi:hypothetical protein